MEAVANNPAFAKKAGVPQAVGKDFSAADKGTKFGTGPTKSRADLQKINRPKTRQGANELFNKGGEIMDKMDKKQDKAMVKKAVGMHDKQQHMGKKTNLTALKKGGTTKMAGGGMAMVEKGGKMVPSFAADGVGKMAKGGGVEAKGKTKGKMVTMKRGGKC